MKFISKAQFKENKNLGPVESLERGCGQITGCKGRKCIICLLDLILITRALPCWWHWLKCNVIILFGWSSQLVTTASLGFGKRSRKVSFGASSLYPKPSRKRLKKPRSSGVTWLINFDGCLILNILFTVCLNRICKIFDLPCRFIRNMIYECWFLIIW